MDLDEAMLATRDFWFQPPESQDNAWQPILDCYADGTPWPPICPPDAEVFLSTLLHTKDSAPGWPTLLSLAIASESDCGCHGVSSPTSSSRCGFPKPKWARKRTTSDRWGCQTHWIDWSMVALLLMLCAKRLIQCTHPRR